MENIGRIFYFVLVIGSTSLPVYSQDPTDDPLEILDNLSEESIEQLQDQDDVLELIQSLTHNPMNLNTLEFKDLERLPFLNSSEIHAILDYRASYGPFIDPIELQVIDQLTLHKTQQLLPFVTVDNKATSNSDGDGYLLLRSTGYFPLRNGFRSINESPAAYRGDPISLLIKYKQFKYRNYSWGGSLEKDSGEPFGFQRKPGFDHLHFHYYKTGLPGKIKTVTVGDYRISLGQGLLQYQGFAITKSHNPLMVKRVSPVIQSYSGTSEYYYFRGVAAEIGEHPHIRNYVFVHHKKRDATIRYSPNGNSVYFSAFQTSGLHRTENEESKRNQIAETMAGHRLQWQNNKWELGFNSLYQRFSLPYQPITRIDNLHRLTGNHIISQSLDFSGYIQSLHVFGEIATQNYKPPAFSVTGLYSFNSRLDGGLLIRRFPAYFAPIYGNTFSARSIPNNESGVYLGLNFYLNEYSRLSFFLDSWKSLWPTFQAHGPNFDQDLFLRYDLSKRRSWEAYAQIKYKHRADNKKNSFPVYNTINYNNQINIRIQFRKIRYKHWRWTNRVEILRYKPEESAPEYGGLVYTDLSWAPMGSRWSLAGRLAKFSTESYTTRIYSYEPDLRYSFSIPAFYGQGWRIAARIRHKWRNGLILELRTGWTFLPGEKQVGSEQNAVQGFYSQQVKIQGIYEF